MSAERAEVGIVADDLTSAADGAGPFVAAGRSVLVGRGAQVPASGKVRAVDTGSRSMAAPKAARAIAAAVTALGDAPLLLKTVDSTLRGHVREELAAAAAAARGRRCVVFAPAFPAAARTTVDGVQLVGGTPVTNTAFALDPVHPAREARLAALIGPGLGAPVRVDAANPGALARAVRERSTVLLDVATQADFDAAVAAVLCPAEVLWIGSPGLARALAARLRPGDRRSPAPALRRARRVLVVVGTLNPASRTQLAHLESAGYEVETVDGGERASRGPGEGAAAVLCLATPARRLSDPEAVSERLAARAYVLVRERGFDAVVATGGHTLNAVLERLGVRVFALAEELQPGFAAATTSYGADRELTIAMKAGGFGDGLALVRAVRQLLA